MKTDGCKIKAVHFGWQAVTSHILSEKKVSVLLEKYVEYLQTGEERMNTSTSFEGEHTHTC